MTEPLTPPCYGNLNAYNYILYFAPGFVLALLHEGDLSEFYIRHVPFPYTLTIIIYQPVAI